MRFDVNGVARSIGSGIDTAPMSLAVDGKKTGGGNGGAETLHRFFLRIKI